MSQARNRPGGVLAAAIILFIFGGLGMLGTVCGVAGTAMQGMVPEQPGVQGKKNPMDAKEINRRMAEEVPSHRIMEVGGYVLGFLLGLIKVIAGFGLLKMNSSARTVAILASWFSILVSLLSTIFTLVFVMPVMDRIFADQAKEMPPEAAGMMKLASGGTMVFTIFIFVFTLIISLVVIIMLSGQKVRTAFADAAKGLPPEDAKPRSRDEGYGDDDDYNSPAR